MPAVLDSGGTDWRIGSLRPALATKQVQGHRGLLRKKTKLISGSKWASNIWLSLWKCLEHKADSWLKPALSQICWHTYTISAFVKIGGRHNQPINKNIKTKEMQINGLKQRLRAKSIDILWVKYFRNRLMQLSGQMLAFTKHAAGASKIQHTFYKS